MAHTGADLFAGALSDRTAFITGGGSGIGFGIACALAKAGARVVIASRNQERIETAVAHIRNAGGQAMGQVVDVRDGDAVQAAVDASVAAYGGLDIFVANAAGNFIVPFEEMSFNAWRTVVDIDLHGTFHCAKAAQPPLARSPFGGRFIAISTMRALEGWPGCAHAAAAKAGVMSLVRTLAIEWGGQGIRCNTIAPGPIAGTEGVQRLYEAESKDNIQSQMAGIPLGRLGHTHDIANAALYLCAQTGDFITGTDLVVDGGRARL